MKKGKIDGKIVDIITIEEYYQNPSLYEANYTAIDGNNGFIYPIRGKLDGRPGMYITQGSPFIKQKDPKPEEAELYSDQNIIRFDEVNTMAELIAAQTKLYNQERSILVSVDNIFKPPIKEDDSSEMIGMKQALIAKNCDIDKYKHRFGPNYQNEKRLFERPSMTLTKLRKACKALDIKATLILEDASPDVPNPMNTKIYVDLTDNSEDNTEGSDE